MQYSTADLDIGSRGYLERASNKKNNLSHTFRRFNHFDLKHLITLQQAERFKNELRAP